MPVTFDYGRALRIAQNSFADQLVYRPDARLLCRTRVAVVQATQARLRDDLALLQRAGRPRDRRVTFQRQVRSGLVMVAEVVDQHTPQMLLVKHDHVVKTFSADGPDQSLDVLRAAWCAASEGGQGEVSLCL